MWAAGEARREREKAGSLFVAFLAAAANFFVVLFSGDWERNFPGLIFFFSSFLFLLLQFVFVLRPVLAP